MHSDNSSCSGGCDVYKHPNITSYQDESQESAQFHSPRQDVVKRGHNIGSPHLYLCRTLYRTLYHRDDDWRAGRWCSEFPRDNSCSAADTDELLTDGY